MTEDVIQQVATAIKRQFHQVERDDIVQELWLWTIEHQVKVNQWNAMGRDGEKLLATSLRRVGRTFAVKERAQIVGYDVEDLYFYSTAQLRELLPIVLDREMWIESGVNDVGGKVSTGTDPANGNNRLAMLCDVKSSLESGRPEDKLLLWTAFGLGQDDHDHAESLGIPVETLRTRIMRAIQRLQKALGGPKPDGLYASGRRAISNAQAQAITRNQEAEE